MKLKKKYKICLGFIFIIGVICIGLGIFYDYSLSGVSSSKEDKQIEIKKGSGSRTIAKILKENNLIRDENIFVLYIKINNVEDLNYGTYLFNESMGVEKIVNILREGSKYNPDEVTLTIKEGLHMREIATAISNVTNNSYDDVINKSNDIDYINSLKNKYWFITDSLNNKDLYYKLEGYLYPDTYKLQNKDVSVEYIFNKMLDQMESVLEEYKNYDYSSMTIHDYLSLASMVEEESANDVDRAKISSVFYNRMKKGMSLGCDVTTRYANRVDDKNKPLTASQFQYKNPYNTRLTDGSMNGKLPVGPISTVSKSSINAAFNPDSHQYIYYIANIKTKETFFYENYNDFLKKKNELSSVNGGF